jgi:AcrR family transcriptional regulator
MQTELVQGKRADAVANHARILEAAQSSLAEHGMDVEMNEVADRAGVGVGTLYRHFANRDEMIRAVLFEAFASLISRIRSTAESQDPAEALRQIPFAITWGQPLFLLSRDPRAAKLLSDVNACGEPLFGEIIDLIAGILERGKQSGAFDAKLDSLVTAATIAGSIAGVVEMFGNKRSLDELAEMLADLHRRMVAPD